MMRKVCPVVFRLSNGVTEFLAFRHPSAGNQLVKGTIEHGEAAIDAAIRELREESGVLAANSPVSLGEVLINSTLWHFFAVRAEELPHRWEHQTQDDCGHVFSFFWHPLAKDLDDEWHFQFHDALIAMRRALPHL